MAILAGVCRGNVGGVLACGRGAIVAACAIPGHGTVIEYCGGPGVGAVAVVAGIAAGNVIPGFAIRDTAVMATGTRTQDRAVVDAIGRRPA